MNPVVLVKSLTLAGLIAVMLSMGLKVKFADIVTSASNVRLVVMGLLANYVLMPAVTIGLLYLFDPHPMVSVGFLILAACPGAPVGPPFVAVAKGDVPFAIGQMVVLAGLSAVLSPLLLSVLLGRFLPASHLDIDYFGIVRSLLVGQMLPLAIGLGVQQRAPTLAERLAKPLGLLANILLLAIVTLLLVREHETLELIRLRGWFGMLLLLSASLVIGWICGGPDRATRKSLALTTGVRNAAVGLVIVSNNFADTPAVSAVVAYSLVSIFGTLMCAFVFKFMATTRA